MNVRLMWKSVVGVCLVVVGLLFLYFFTLTAISSGLLVTITEAWTVSFLISLGCSMMFHFSLKAYAKSLIVGTIFTVLIGLIFASPLSLDFHLLLANILLVIMVLIIRYSITRRPREHKESRIPIRIRLVIGSLLIVVSGLLLFFIIAYALDMGLFFAFFLIVLGLSVAVAGYSLIAKFSLERFVEWFLSSMFLLLVLWTFVLPLELAVLLGSLLTISLLLSFYWYYQRRKSPRPPADSA